MQESSKSFGVTIRLVFPYQAEAFINDLGVFSDFLLPHRYGSHRSHYYDDPILLLQMVEIPTLPLSTLRCQRAILSEMRF